MEKFEDILDQISKPEVSGLKHEDMLAKSITKVKDKSAVSLWWLSIPVYMVAAFTMKSFYTPHLSIASALHELFDRKGYLAVLLFLILPIILIIINVINARQLFFLYGNRKRTAFLKLIYTEILIIFLSLVVLLIYFYETFTH